MKYLLIILCLFYLSANGQGITAVVYMPGSNSWVSKTLYESNNPQLTVSGNAGTATTLQTARTINGISFNGSANITVTADASALTGAALNLTVAVAESQITNLTNDLAAKAPLASPTFTGTVTLPANAVSNSMLAGSISSSKLVGSDITLTESQTTNLVADLGSKQGVSAAATSATTGTMTVPMTSATQTVFNITPTGACTFNATGGIAGARMTFIITTSGTSAFVLTWGTNFKTTATLSTGTTTAKVFCVNFICKDGTNWYETGRTTAM